MLYVFTMEGLLPLLLSRANKSHGNFVSGHKANYDPEFIFPQKKVQGLFPCRERNQARPMA